jgi:C2H2 type zinc finger protein
MGAYSPSPPAAAGSISVIPEQRPMISGLQSPMPATALPRISNIRGHHARSEGGFFVSKNTTDHAPSPLVESATPRSHPFPHTFSSASSSGVFSAAEPTSSTFPPYLRSRYSTSAPVPQEPAYSTPKRASSTSPVHPSVSPTHRSFLSPANPSENSIARPVPQRESTEQERAGRTLRSVRTRSEDVFAEYELNADGSGGRWVCQCGSTFVRDSDWERHAMHSLSHSEGGGYDCSICDISFTRSDAMFRHRRKKHGDTMPGAKGSGE